MSVDPFAPAPRGSVRVPRTPLALELDALIGSRAVSPLFQPIVDLATGDVLAHEALSRGPAYSELERPDALFAAARDAGRLAEVDHLCRVRALEAIVAAGPHAPSVLFLHREPDALSADPASAAQLVLARRLGMRVVLELPERALRADPARLLAFAERARAANVGIALNDVGVAAESLAVMPFLSPDVVKLDMSLVHQRVDLRATRVLAALTAYTEEHRVEVLAAGIETEEHEDTARALGATLGQGWRFGRPAPLRRSTDDGPRRPPQHSLALREPHARPAPEVGPFAAVARVRPTRVASEAVLFEIRRTLEHQAAQTPGLAAILLTCPQAPDVSAAYAAHYAGLARAGAFVVALGPSMPAELVAGVRGTRLAPDDPAAGEWDLVVVGPHYAAALLSRPRSERASDEPTFDYVLTYDRPLVLDAARALMHRALPRRETDPEVAAVLTGEIETQVIPSGSRPSRA